MKFSFFCHFHPRHWHLRCSIDREQHATFFKFHLGPLALVAVRNKLIVTP